MPETVPGLAREAASKIVLLVLDGLGGVRTAARGSELYEARTPNLDLLAREGSSGLLQVIGPGITPGSGAGHTALFGYDPIEYDLGRGALSAAGLGFDLKPGDVAARVNFCTLAPDGTVADRRAGRIPTEENRRLCRMILDGLDAEEGVEVFLETEREHRALLVLRGDRLSPEVADTDPGVVGEPPSAPHPLSPAAERTAEVLGRILTRARAVLAGERANFLLLRGFDTLRHMPSFWERYRIRALGVAGYPAYAGIARIFGMDTSPLQASLAAGAAVVERSWADHDFFFLHHKRPDSAGEDGDFEGKVAAIEEVDALVPRLLALGPDVLCVTGDHATPCHFRSHSWHPVPVVLWGPAVGVDGVDRFDEEAARGGALGTLPGRDLMALLLAAGSRLARFGA